MILRLALSLTLLFALPIALIRAQPAHEYPLRDFLASPGGCRTPCFLGVRPRTTTVDEAVELLRSNTAIADVWHDGQALLWRWLADPGETYGFHVGEDTTIDGLLLPGDITLGELRLALGEPGRITLTTGGYHSRTSHVAWVLEYPQHGVHVFAEFPVCQTTLPALWRLRQDNTLADGFFIGIGPPDYIRVMPSQPVELDRRHWATQLWGLCQR